jgi:hypothetical protein
VGALGHYLEAAGLATASISLIRLHTEKIRPPRALWVPFPLGRPLGAPDDPDFQKRVLRALLALFSETSGPVLRDYPEEAPYSASGADLTGMACPLRLDAPEGGEEPLEAAVRREIRELQPWYDLARERRQRTTFGVAGLSIDEVVQALFGWLSDPPHVPEVAGRSPEDVLKLAAEDLKAFYFEAVGGQPQPLSGRALADWFWAETTAAKLFVALRERCVNDAMPLRQQIGRNLMVPRDQWGRFGITQRWWHAPKS